MKRVALTLIGLLGMCLIAGSAVAAHPSLTGRYDAKRQGTRFDDGTRLDHHGDRVNVLGQKVYPQPPRHQHHGHHPRVIVPHYRYPTVVHPPVYRPYYNPYYRSPYYNPYAVYYYNRGVGIAIGR